MPSGCRIYVAGRNGACNVQAVGLVCIGLASLHGFHYPSSRPEFTGRVDGFWHPSWRPELSKNAPELTTRQLGPSTRVSKNALEFSGRVNLARELGPWTRVVETGLYTSYINSDGCIWIWNNLIRNRLVYEQFVSLRHRSVMSVWARNTIFITRTTASKQKKTRRHRTIAQRTYRLPTETRQCSCTCHKCVFIVTCVQNILPLHALVK